MNRQIKIGTFKAHLQKFRHELFRKGIEDDEFQWRETLEDCLADEPGLVQDVARLANRFEGNGATMVAAVAFAVYQSVVASREASLLIDGSEAESN